MIDAKAARQLTIENSRFDMSPIEKAIKKAASKGDLHTQVDIDNNMRRSLNFIVSQLDMHGYKYNRETSAGVRGQSYDYLIISWN